MTNTEPITKIKVEIKKRLTFLKELVEVAAEKYFQRIKSIFLSTLEHPTAKDSFIAGAEWMLEQCDKDLSEKIAAAYQLGLADKEKQMMSEAVDADVKLTLHDKTGDVSLYTGYLPKELGIKCDDKVRIIIVKEN